MARSPMVWTCAPLAPRCTANGPSRRPGRSSGGPALRCSAGSRARLSGLAPTAAARLQIPGVAMLLLDTTGLPVDGARGFRAPMGQHRCLVIEHLAPAHRIRARMNRGCTARRICSPPTRRDSGSSARRSTCGWRRPPWWRSPSNRTGRAGSPSSAARNGSAPTTSCSAT